MAHRVQLAVSPLGGLPGLAQAWHSSVLLDGEEYSFSDAGITVSRGAASHAATAARAAPGERPDIIDMGSTTSSGDSLLAALGRHFAPGTYDVLRKNCNSFSDASLFFLVQKRLDKKYRALDSLGAPNSRLVQAVCGNAYTPNPRAASFDLEKLISELDPAKVWCTPGRAIGGSLRDPSTEALRGARLARFADSTNTGHSPQSRASQQESAGLHRPVLAVQESPPQSTTEQLLGDEELARRLAEEGDNDPVMYGDTASHARHSDEELARRLSDEELACSLQAAEESAAQSERAAARTGGSNTLPHRRGEVFPLDFAIGAGVAAIGGAAQAFGHLVQELNHAAVNSNSHPMPPQTQRSAELGRRQSDVFDRPLPVELLGSLTSAANGSAQLVGAVGGLLSSALTPGATAPTPTSNRQGANSDILSDRTVTLIVDQTPTSNAPSGRDSAQAEGANSAQTQCMICCQEFSLGDQLRMLPCLHRYHIGCIDPWLRQSTLCPICKHDLRN